MGGYLTEKSTGCQITTVIVVLLFFHVTKQNKVLAALYNLLYFIYVGLASCGYVCAKNQTDTERIRTFC